MCKIKEYIILRGYSSEVETEVAEKMAEGRQPFGSPFVNDHFVVF